MDPTAVMGKRIGAWVIDLVISIVTFLLALRIFGDSATTVVNPCDSDQAPTLCFNVNSTVYFAEGSDATLVFGVAFGLGVLSAWILQGATGGTIGKLAVGLRVVDKDTGNIAGYGKSLARTLLWIADGVPFCFPLVGLITGVSSKGHRRVGDMAAGTLVVDKSDVGRPPIVPGLNAQLGGSYVPPAPGSVGYAPAPAPAPAPSAVSDGVSAPKWDSDRNAYIQWDATTNQWMLFDNATEQWRPI